MKEQLITFETAQIAKDKGFSYEEGVINFYVNRNSKVLGLDEKGRSFPIKGQYKKCYSIGEAAPLYSKNAIFAPTQSLLQKWLREEHGYHVHIYQGDDGNKWWLNACVEDYPYLHESQNFTYLGSIKHDNYEDAIEEGLQEALKLIK